MAVLTAAVILGIAGSASPLFVSAVGGATLGQELAQYQCPYVVGLEITASGPFGASAFQATGTGEPGPPSGETPEQVLARRGPALEQATAGIPGLGRRVVTLIGSDSSALRADGTGIPQEVKLLSRPGSLSHVRILSSAHVPGVWLPGPTASALGLRAGDSMTLNAQSGRRVPTSLAGTYQEFTKLPALPPFWCSLINLVRPPNPNAGATPIGLVDQPSFMSLSRALGEEDDQSLWEYPLSGPITLAEARSTAGGVFAAQQAIEDQDSTLSSLFAPFPGVVTQVPPAVERTDATIAAVRGPVDAISIAGMLVALLVIGSAGVYWAERRRTEASLLFTKGVGSVSIGFKVLLECVLPVAVAAWAGWVAGGELVRILGPSGPADPAASTAALRRVVVLAVVALVVLAGVAALTVRREMEERHQAEAGRAWPGRRGRSRCSCWRRRPSTRSRPGAPSRWR